MPDKARCWKCDDDTILKKPEYHELNSDECNGCDDESNKANNDYKGGAVKENSNNLNFDLLLLMWFSLGFSQLWRAIQFILSAFKKCLSSQGASKDSPTIPESVNYHFTRQCNYKCGFCFHTAKTSFVLPIDEAKRGLKLLSEAGMQKVNFSGGEPFIHKKGQYLGELVKYCKEDLKLTSVSIVSNGSLIKEEWFQEFGEYLDILAISCDSFDESTNAQIGRYHKHNDHLNSLKLIRNWCQIYKVAFKINTVVNVYNWEEDMSREILELNPIRWKVFQCLLIEGENVGLEAKRNAESFVISDEKFDTFLERHRKANVHQMVPESNTQMRNSYLILDEYVS
jgi:radical S-adenosyl methionine domain-containing protein 2